MRNSPPAGLAGWAFPLPMNYKYKIGPCPKCGGECEARALGGKAGYKKPWVTACDSCDWVSDIAPTKREAAERHNQGGTK